MKLCYHCGRFEAQPRSRYCVGCEDHVYYARKEAAEDEMGDEIKRRDDEDCD